MKFRYLQSKASAAAALSIETRKAEIEKDLGKNKPIVCTQINKYVAHKSQSPSLYTVGGHKALHKRSGMDIFTQQQKYAYGK